MKGRWSGNISTGTNFLCTAGELENYWLVRVELHRRRYSLWDHKNMQFQAWEQFPKQVKGVEEMKSYALLMWRMM